MVVSPYLHTRSISIYWEVGTQKIHTYLKESERQMAVLAKKKQTSQPRKQFPVSTPEVEALVCEIIGRVADKWTMLVLEALEEHGTVCFTRLSELVDGVSQKMLTKTLRQMESDGFVTRTIYPVVPPRVEYQLTPLGSSLSEAFCGVWIWAERHHDEIVRARTAFLKKKRPA
jgi:DNA-binding HxlR family transcriptional regulator